MKIKLGYAEFSIASIQEDDDSDGMFDPCAREIRVTPKRDPREQAHVLLHELLHAAWWMCGQPEGKFTEEGSVSMLAKGLTTILHDNPVLFAMLHQALANGQNIV